MSTQDLAAYLYANYGLVALTQPERLKMSFEVLADLYNRVGLRINKEKTVSMACQPCHTPDRMSVVEYERRVTRKGLTYQERQKMLIQ